MAVQVMSHRSITSLATIRHAWTVAAPEQCPRQAFQTCSSRMFTTATSNPTSFPSPFPSASASRAGRLLPAKPQIHRFKPLLVQRHAVSSKSFSSLSTPRATPSTITSHLAPSATSSRVTTSAVAATRSLASSAKSAPLSTASASAEATAAIPAALTWSRYLELRAVRRRFSLVSSILAAAATGIISFAILAAQDLDQIAARVPFGLDPIMALGMATLGSVALGWLLGPVVGNFAFRRYARRLLPEMREKDRDFYRRISAKRTDPSRQTMSNPIPDYYGEKISSIAAYRQWLRDQRAYSRKRQVY